MWCAERESGLGSWSQDFVPSAVPPRPWLLAFKTIRYAEVWAPLSWNESSGGRQRCQPGGPCPPPWVPLHYAWSHWPSSFLLANSLRHFPITAGTAGALVDSTQFGALSFSLLVCTLVFLGEGGWSPRSWNLCGVGVVCPSQGYAGLCNPCLFRTRSL